MLLEASIESTAKDMLLILQRDTAIKICDYVISKAESLSSLHFVVNYLNSLPDLSSEMKNNYILLDIGVSMLNAVPEHDKVMN